MRSGRKGIPVRSCVQCGASGEKGRFLRIAGRPGGDWEPDPGGRMPGRGIYVCRTAECVERFVKRIRSPKGGARWKLGPGGGPLADGVAAWWTAESGRQGE